MLVAGGGGFCVIGRGGVILGDPVPDVDSAPDRYDNSLLHGIYGHKGREARVWTTVWPC